MVSASEIAENHQRNVIQRVEVASQRGLRFWRRMDLADLDRSWQVQGPAIVATASAAQFQNAVESTSYANAAGRAASVSSTATRTLPEAFVGVDGSGRSLEGLLHGAVTTTKEALGAGLAGPVSFQAGATYLTAMIKTAIADLARNSDMAAAGGHGWTRYVRVVSPGACSRCAILAGATGYRAGFKRHPACKCTAYPLPEGEKAPQGVYDDPSQYFDSLDKAEQDRVFTKAGAEAIRAGASVDRVVGARRGASGISFGNRIVKRQGLGRLESQIIGVKADGAPLRVYSTSEATSRRGFYGRQQAALGGNRVRLMPESIMQIADGDAATARVLLRDAGYIETDFRMGAADRLAMQTTDREFAQRIYRAAGYAI